MPPVQKELQLAAVIKVAEEVIKGEVVAATKGEVGLRDQVVIAAAEEAAVADLADLARVMSVVAAVVVLLLVAAEGRSTAIAVAVLLAPVTQDVVPALQLVDNFIDLINQESD